MADLNIAPVTAEEAKDAVMTEDHEPGKYGAVPIPPFLIALAEQAIVQYGPGVVDLLKQAAQAGIDALAQRFHIVPKSH